MPRWSSCELTAEPSARLRAIHYAHELGFADLVDDQYCTDTATAEAEMSLWLSQPQQMGIPPTAVEVVEVYVGNRYYSFD